MYISERRFSCFRTLSIDLTKAAVTGNWAVHPLLKVTPFLEYFDELLFIETVSVIGFSTAEPRSIIKACGVACRYPNTSTVAVNSCTL